MKVIAHRGASHEAPENSLEAIRRAVELGVHAIEIDVHLSQDHVPVVIHNDALEDGRKVAELGWKELEKYIPSLADVLHINRGEIELFIELKAGPDNHKLVEKTLEVINGHSHTLIGSFSHDILNLVKALSPEQKLIGIALDQQAITAFKKMGIDHFAIDHKIFTSELKDELNHVWIWTIDDVERALSLSPHGSITNNPRAFLKKP